MIILDLFCGAGGASKGYSQAGFDVVGVDVKPQPQYPFEFIQSDWMDYLQTIDLSRFTAIHASPPCQGYSVTKSIHGNKTLKIIPLVRQALIETGLPWIIENVPGARSDMVNPVTLRGNLFGLRVIRDRLFETNFYLPQPKLEPVTEGTNAHRGFSQFNADGSGYICVAGNNFKAEHGRKAMGIDWMSRKYLAQAIPPAYTEWISGLLKSHLEANQ